jgi:hypothetical protein
MASFRSLTADRQPLNEFKSRASKITSGIDLHIFEWAENTTTGCERSGLRSAGELDAHSEGAVRVMLVPVALEEHQDIY